MLRKLTTLTLSLAFALTAVCAQAQEATVHHGFLFFAGEKYTVDEKTYGIYDDGHEFEKLIGENPEALSAFGSYEAWHITADVFTGLSFAAIVFGAVYYMPGVAKKLPESTGIISFASGGGLLVAGIVFELFAYGSISSAAEIYNRELIDEGPALELNKVPVPTLALTPGGAQLAFSWHF
ncbi:MAG TPA: hypothetical protein VM425_01135 [Myxococcota bacterium]|nr:hypothetical protein [Myxococcota bacterium]